MLAFLTIIGIYEYRLISKKQELEKRNREIERQRDQLEKMVVRVEDLSKARLRFFTNISHELRTPLTLISGPVEQLQHSGDTLSPVEHRRLYGIIERNASRLLKLINQLLDIRRLEQTTPELNLQEMNLAEYVGDMVRLFENLAEERNIYLDFDDRSENAGAAVDPDKIEKQVELFDRFPEAVAVYCDYRTIDADGNVTQRTSALGTPRPSGFILPQLLFGNCVGSPSVVMVQKKPFIEAGGRQQAAPALEGGAKGRLVGHCLRAGVDHSRSHRWVLGP